MLKIRPSALAWVLLTALVAGPGPALAQDASEAVPLESFVQHIARLWGDADVGALVDLIPQDGELMLDAGEGIEAANSRHAAAALRALFSQNESVSARAIRVTVSSPTPLRGFGELTWTFRPRGAPGEQARAVYVAAILEEGVWRVTELRLMP